MTTRSTGGRGFTGRRRRNAGGFQSFAGTELGAHQANYGFDAQVPLGNQLVDGAPATILQLSHLTTLELAVGLRPRRRYAAVPLQSARSARRRLARRSTITSPPACFRSNTISEPRISRPTTCKSQVIAEAQPIGGPIPLQGETVSTDALSPEDRRPPPVQTERFRRRERYAVLRYNGDPTSHIHYSLAAYDSNFSSFRNQLRSARRLRLDADRQYRGARVGRDDVPNAAALRALVPPPERARAGGRHHLYRESESAARSRDRLRSRRRADLRQSVIRCIYRSISIRRICARRRTSST